MKKFIISAVSTVVLLSGCASNSDSFKERLAPEGVTYTEDRVYGYDALIVAYRTERKLKQQAPVNVCLDVELKSVQASFSGTNTVVGPATGNLYTTNSKTTADANNQVRGIETFSTGTEQLSISAPDAIGLMNLTFNLKHQVTARYVDGVLKFKFSNLNYVQSNAGYAAAGKFTNQGFASWIPSFETTALKVYNATADRVAACVAGDL
ncbi:hypothetical protein ACWJJH_03270 [Endozoicomonadaceae bacterium StTr2]